MTDNLTDTAGIAEVQNGNHAANDAFDHAPNFVVIGPGKSGTSWLFEVLGAHPSVCMSSAKETMFFETEFHRGLSWYQKFFRQCDCPGRDHAIGEISNTYIFSADVAQNIRNTFPQMKIIATLRSPIERAHSHYLFERRNGTLGDSFEDAIKQRPDLLSRGKYDQHLQPYFERFSADQIRVLIYDDLKADVNSYAQSLWDFIGVDSFQDADVLERRVLGASEARSKLAARLFVGAGRIVRRAGFPELVTKIKGSAISKMLFRPLDRSKHTMHPETKSRLKEYFREDVAKLSDRLGRDLTSLWIEEGAPA
ncbi:MAG: sulfotransferase [Rubripirellula sp.]